MTTGVLPLGTHSLQLKPYYLHLHTVFRTIFDNNEHPEFKKKLDDRIKHHDKDIERLCNVYYQGFIESVTELLEVKSQSKNLNVQTKFYFELFNV